MATLLTKQIATITELREPQKVLDRANGKPVAILKNSQVVAYLVPETATGMDGHAPMTMEQLNEILARTRARSQPVLDYLKDK